MQGSLVHVHGTKVGVHTFLGIPFAKAPLGPLRFAPPQPPEPWSGVRDGTSYPAMYILLGPWVLGALGWTGTLSSGTGCGGLCISSPQLQAFSDGNALLLSGKGSSDYPVEKLPVPLF